MPRASIDLGSNSVLLTVLSDDGRVLHDEARVVGLGRGLGDRGALRPDRRAAALSALSDYARVAVARGVPAPAVVALATSAARRATDADAFFAEVAEATGLRFRVIPGDEEARLTWLGGLSGLAVDHPVMVVDLGGGSTELAIGGPQLRWKHSYEIGSVRLTEAVLGEPARVAGPADLERMERAAREVFAQTATPERPVEVVGVAGSVTTLAAAALGLVAYDGARVHGSTLTDAQLASFQQRLLGASPEARRALFTASPERADFLLAGATVLREVLASAGKDRMRVSDRGLRHGALALPG